MFSKCFDFSIFLLQKHIVSTACEVFIQLLIRKQIFSTKHVTQWLQCRPSVISSVTALFVHAHTRLCVLFQLDLKVLLLSSAASPAFGTVGVCLVISGEISKAESRLPNVWFINILFFVTSRYSRLVRKSLL